VLGIDTAKKIITRNNSPDVGFDRSINPYKGCEHGCIYCFARPTHAYLNLSPGLDFETKIFRKPDAPELLRQELSARNYVPATIQLGHQYRRLSADRTDRAADPPHPGGAGRVRASGRDSHQVGR